MMQISEFSKLARVSVRMLRYFDQKDIFKPSYIDENGFRYYRGDQLSKIERILQLQSKGFQLREIKLLLMDSITKKEKDAIIHQYAERVKKEYKIMQMQMKYVR